MVEPCDLPISSKLWNREAHLRAPSHRWLSVFQRQLRFFMLYLADFFLTLALARYFDDARRPSHVSSHVSNMPRTVKLRICITSRALSPYLLIRVFITNNGPLLVVITCVPERDQDRGKHDNRDSSSSRDKDTRNRANQRKKSNESPTLGSMCSRRTQMPTFQLEMFRRIVLDPKIFCQLVRIRWGQRVGNERPETFLHISQKQNKGKLVGAWGRS
jgi:hypothetical protein